MAQSPFGLGSGTFRRDTFFLEKAERERERDAAWCKLWIQCKQKEERRLLENTPLSPASGLFQGSAVSIQPSGTGPPAKESKTHACGLIGRLRPCE